MSERRLVDLRNVVKEYATPAGPFLALRGVDLEIDPGEFVAVIGKSGSGKSTLINAIAGIDQPTSGEVHVAGSSIHELDENSISAWRGLNLGVIFQFFQLLPTLTLAENVILPMELARRGSPRERRDRALALLERVEMAEHADKYPSAVSGGQQQRVAIARALANDPALIVADEPTGSLDSRTADTIFQLFEELVDQGKTILMVTHDNDLAARASRVVLIVDGEVVESHVRSALAGISDDDLSDVSTRLEAQVLGPGATVFDEGDTPDRFYIIVRGRLEVLRSRPGGTPDVVAVLGPGQYFGETGLLEAMNRTATVRVAPDTDASLLALEADVFRRLVAENSMAHDSIARVMRQRMTADTVRSAMPAELEADLADIADEVVWLTFAPGDPILRPGEPADRFWVVTEGVVEMTHVGQTDIAFTYRQGGHFGTSGLSHDGRSIATLRAAPDRVGETRLASIPAALHRQLATRAGLSDALVALLVAEAESG
jgi:ABC-type lipoprotein export system ATPase subunit/CRP-like cAMP-binding protein